MTQRLTLFFLLLFSTSFAWAWNAPTISSPANNALVYTGVSLDWGAVIGSQFYQLQVDTSNSFSSPALQDFTKAYINSASGNGDTREFMDDLIFGRVYHWRVRAYITGDTSVWVSRTFTTRDDVDLVSPTNNALGFTGTVFNWNAHTGVDFYDIEVDTSLNFNSPALQQQSNAYINSASGNNDTDHFFTDLFYGTTYYWRVRARNAVDSSAWTTVRVFQTRDDLDLVTPVNNDIGFTGKTFNWNTHVGVDFYDIEIDTSLSFSSPALQQQSNPYINSASGNTDTDHFFTDLFFGTTYYWRVRSRNAVDTSAWTTVRIYNTRDDLDLITPVNNDLGFAGRTFNWNAHAGVDFYDIEIDTATSFNSPALQQQTESYINSNNGNNDTDHFFSDLYFGETYYWRVRARNAVDTSAWTTRTYNTRDDIDLISPANNALGFTGSTFNWNAHAGVDFYDIEIDTSTSFNSPALQQQTESYINSNNGNNDTDHFFSDLYFGETYYWRVRARNAVDTSAWTTRIYNTRDDLDLISPANNSLGFTGNTFNWNAHAGVDFYDIEIDTSTSFNSLALQQRTETYINSNNGNNDTDHFFSDLYFGETYYWRVRARNAVDTSAWTAVRIYHTRDDVVLVSPSNGGGNLPTTGTNLNWNSHWGVDQYEMEFDTTFQFSSPLLVQVFENYINSSNGNGDTQEFSGPLLANQVYYWRVRAINNVDTSAWTTWVFSTGSGIQVPDVPILLSPADGAIGTGTSPSLDWNNATNAQSYVYEYDLTPTFSSPVSGTATASNSPALSLANSTVYYWRVRALNANVTSSWSPTWSFDTGCNLPVPNVAGTGVCAGESVLLSGPGGTYNWYDAASDGNLLATGTSYNYGTATATDTVYVAEVAGNCESGRTAVAIEVFPLPAVPVIAQVGSDSLTVSSGAATYQWFLNGSPLPQSGSTIFVNQSGTYTAIAVSTEGCLSDSSAGFSFVFISTLPAQDLDVQLWPNPSQGRFQVNLPLQADVYTLRVVSAQGQIVFEQEILSNGSPIDVQPGNLAGGLYHVWVRTTHAQAIIPLVVQ